MKSSVVTRLGVVVAASVALLAGCGGSGTEVGTTSFSAAPLVLQMDGRVQPASADQGVASIKSRNALVAPTPARVSLEALASSKTEALAGGVGPRQVGVSRDVMATKAAAQTLQQLKWTTAANGVRVAAISFTAQGAHGLRLGVVAKQLAPGTLLRVYSQTNPGNVFQISGQEVLQRIQMNLNYTGFEYQGKIQPLVLSIGLSEYMPVEDLEVLVQRVDHALAHVRKQGGGTIHGMMSKSRQAMLFN